MGGEIGVSGRSDGRAEIAEEVAEEEVAARIRLEGGSAGIDEHRDGGEDNELNTGVDHQQSAPGLAAHILFRIVHAAFIWVASCEANHCRDSRQKIITCRNQGDRWQLSGSKRFYRNHDCVLVCAGAFAQCRFSQ